MVAHGSTVHCTKHGGRWPQKNLRSVETTSSWQHAQENPSFAIGCMRYENPDFSRNLRHLVQPKSKSVAFVKPWASDLLGAERRVCKG